MKKWGVIVIFLAGIFSSISCYAVSFKGLLGLGAEFGGDSILTLSYSDGSTSDVFAGQGVSLFAGAVAQDLLGSGPGSVELDVQGTLGIKYSTIPKATNATVDYYRFPVELLVFAHWNGLRIGAGPAYHIFNSLVATGALSAYDFGFDNALGVTAQIDYTFFEHLGIGARYTSISYQPQLPGASKISAGNFGAELTYFF